MDEKKPPKEGKRVRIIEVIPVVTLELRSGDTNGKSTVGGGNKKYSAGYDEIQWGVQHSHDIQ